MNAHPSATGRILVVDDEEPVALLLQQWLADEGYDTHHALGFSQARALLTAAPFDVVTLDIRMPGVEGLEALRWVVREHPEIAVLMLTGIDTVASVIEAMRAGAVGYLLKPLNLELVREEIARAMERQRLVAANRAHRLELERRVEAQAQGLRVASDRLADRERELLARDRLVQLQMCPPVESTRYYEQISIAEGFRILSSSLEQSWGGGGRDDYSENLEGLTERLNELTSIGAVFYTVPKLVDFDGGKTWKPILHGFVPRLFWKDKPATKVITNDYFNIKLGFQDSMETLDTTASMPLIAEAYFNAGWFGVVGVAALCGLAFGLLSWAFQSNSRLWYVGVFFIVVDLRSTEGLAALVSSVWKTFLFALFWLAVLRVVSGLRRQRQARALP